jgi:hypothetical protein
MAEQRPRRPDRGVARNYGGSDTEAANTDGSWTRFQRGPSAPPVRVPLTERPATGQEVVSVPVKTRRVGG